MQKQIVSAYESVVSNTVVLVVKGRVFTSSLVKKLPPYRKRYGSSGHSGVCHRGEMQMYRD